MKWIKAVRDFVSDLGIKELPGGWILVCWVFVLLRLGIIRLCDAIIILWEPDWEPYDGGL